jgi:hypothetical protein
MDLRGCGGNGRALVGVLTDGARVSASRAVHSLSCSYLPSLAEMMSPSSCILTRMFDTVALPLAAPSWCRAWMMRSAPR